MAQQQPTPFPDTAHFLEAANDTARNFRAVYVAYLVIAFYILVIISSTSDELLFRAGNVQMPIINTSVPVVWFFIVAPWILFLLHLNLLIQAVFLSTKVHRYTSRLAKEKIHTRGLLFPAPLAHLLVADTQRRVVQWILRGVVFFSLVLLPPGILIYAEIHFLTYQNEPITWLHRTAILLDITLLWCLWPHIITPPDEGEKECSKRSPWKRRAATFASVATGLFVLVIADIPGGTMENFISANALRDWLEPGLDRRYQLKEQILVQEEPPPEILSTHLAACKFQNPDDRTNCQTEIKPGTPIWCQYAKPLPLQGRTFRHANLQKAVLCGVDLSADLDDAGLSVDLSGANLGMIKLHGADLHNTKLQGANLSEARLQGTDLRWAELQGANLSKAELQGANLHGAKLQGADLIAAELQGADLSEARLQGADLIAAELQGANLSKARLQGANLSEARLQGADLSEAELQGANLSEARLQGTDLIMAELQGADLSYTELQGADLSWAYLAGSDLSNANLNLADLRDVDLASKPNQKQLEKAITIIKSIKQQALRDQALELVKRAETEEATIFPSSIEDAIFREGSALYGRLQEPENRELLQTDHFTQTKEDDYNTKLVAYLIDSPSCRDEDSYVAEEIIRSRIIRSRIIRERLVFFEFIQALTLKNESRKLAAIFAEKLNLDSKVPSLLCQGAKKQLDGLSEEERTELREIIAESANQ